MTIYRNKPWIEEDNYKDFEEYRSLSSAEQAEADFYHEYGYLIYEDIDILENVDINTLKREVNKHYDWSSRRIQDLWRISKGVKDIACNSFILNKLKMLYGRNMIPFQTLNFINSTEQATHSDFIHFATIPERFMVGVWVALEDITDKQGPLHYYEGSHKLPEYTYEELQINARPDEYADPYTYSRGAYREYELKLPNYLKSYKYKTLPIKKGSFLIWASNLAHGGTFQEDKTLNRWSQVTHYLGEGVIAVTPMFSYKSKGKWFTRRPNNIITGGFNEPSFNGNPVKFTPTDLVLRNYIQYNE